jgi:RNA recognition motif-containing protein
MSTRAKNPEVYVKGFGKDTTKDDLKKWFREFGKIVCIQYKGPYAFIVSLSLPRNLKTITMPRQRLNK